MSKCLCWSLGHAEQLLFYVYAQKSLFLVELKMAKFFDILITRACDIRVHRAGSQLVWKSDKRWEPVKFVNSAKSSKISSVKC